MLWRHRSRTKGTLDAVLLRYHLLYSSIPPQIVWYVFVFDLATYPSSLPAGILSPEQQRAWREKMGLIGIILLLMAGVGFLTFGFTESVCGTPPRRFHAGQIANNSVVIHGFDYDFSKFKHPRAGTTFNGQTNPLLEGNWKLAGNDASFLFQKVNRNCLGLITKAPNSTITGSGNTLNWYFPCNIFSQSGPANVNLTGYEASTNCHVNLKPGTTLTNVKQGQVYYTWDDVKSPSRNLAVYESCVSLIG
jgi:chitin synthase